MVKWPFRRWERKPAAATRATISNKQEGLFYTHHPTDRIAHTTAFVTPVVEHWLERAVAQCDHHERLTRRPIAPWAIDPTTRRTMSDWSDEPSHHERLIRRPVAPRADALLRRYRIAENFSDFRIKVLKIHQFRHHRRHRVAARHLIMVRGQDCQVPMQHNDRQHCLFCFFVFFVFDWVNSHNLLCNHWQMHALFNDSK